MLLKAHKHIFLIFIAIALFFGRTTHAQELKFKHINSEQGLSTAGVNCILQDSKGFMWFGTQDGLNKYDAYNIIVYKHKPSDTNSISSSFINVLFEDKNKNLWIGTDNGLDAYNLITGKLKHYKNEAGNNQSISNNSVRCIIEDQNGMLWVGTDAGLNSLDPETRKFKRYLNDVNIPQSISGNAIWCLHESSDGRIWAGTIGGGLNCFNKKTNVFNHYYQYDANGEVAENSKKVRSIHQDRQGIFWLGTSGEGIQIFDPKSGVFLNNLKSKPDEPNSLSNNGITTITEDANGILWIGTYGGGLDQYFKKTGRFIHHQHDEKNPGSISSNRIKHLYHDKNASVWIATDGGGISTYFGASNKFQFYKKNQDVKNGLISNVVFALMQDRDRQIWIGTSQGGVSSFNRETNTYEHYPQLSTATNNSILSLCEDSDGQIWVGTWGDGVNIYNKKTKSVKSFPFLTSQQNGTITCIYQDKKGTMWIGSYTGGLFSYDKQTAKIKNYNLDAGLSSNNIYSVYEDDKGIIWIGTDGGGLNALNTETEVIRKYQKNEKNNSISSNSINNIYQDKKGNLWFATATGLNRFNPKTEHFENYFEKDGLPNDFIYCVMPDKQGNLWMTTNKGVSKFNPDTINENGSAFRNYDINDGLQGMEFNQGAFFHNKKTGEMFAGGVNGFNTFIPEKILDNRMIPNICIVSYKSFGKEVELDTLIYNKQFLDLSWKQNFFSFDFVALDYLIPGKNKYSFKLEGIDEDWSPPGTQRYASYTDLRGGDYVFRVRATNSDGVWNNDGVALFIRINPPFWKTNLFYLLCFITIIGGFAGFVKYRTASIKKENKILEEKVEERTQELAQKNKDITSSIQYAKRIQLAILPPLEQIFKHLPQSFLMYKPKDIVSGDFYWFGTKKGKIIIAAVDCTGHGVPGAFMSMIGHNLLNQIISENSIIEPDQILNALHNGVQAALKQGTNIVDTSDGMDVALCTIDKNKKEIEFDKFSIGGSQLDDSRKFSKHTIKFETGDSFYMTSDGYADQFGGEKGKKFMARRFSELLKSIKSKPMSEQEAILEQTFENWKGSYQQVDDILVIGFRF